MGLYRFGRTRTEQVTRPIQLLAAMMAGLVILEGELIYASSRIFVYQWISAWYAISAILFVPIFLIFIFKLLVKYRIQLLSDSYFMKHQEQLYEKGISFKTIKKED